MVQDFPPVTMIMIKMVITRAASHKSGWWFNNCQHINLNQQPPYVHLKSKNYNPLKVEMKIRQIDCIAQ